MSDAPLKPCLCGNTNITITLQGGGDYRISCDECGYSTSVQPDFLLAAAEWNLRNKDAVAKTFRRGRPPKKARKDG
ncbi:hypothetical protein [Cloacibacillus sp. An23]|uniref:hypothetical protein n=1 Tax=Cloacibacillus sp. An23 TaxID=1965591 RepID=UPI001177CCB1|nr:hypothetical protein [Cloacibacillus sp. An23]